MTPKELIRQMGLIISFQGVVLAATETITTIFGPEHLPQVHMSIWALSLITAFVYERKLIKDRVPSSVYEESGKYSLKRDIAIMAVSMLHPIIAAGIMGARVMNITNLMQTNRLPINDIGAVSEVPKLD